MAQTIKIILLTVLMALSLTQDMGKLIFVQQVFKHGARYPINIFQNDGSKFADNEHSLGELTKQGKSMHYILGQQLYKQYWPKLFAGTVFDKIYNQSKFYVKSTDVNRTIESVQSQLMGIFENLNQLNLDNIDIHYSLPQWPKVTTRSIGPVYSTSPCFNPVPVHVEKGYPNPYDNGDFLRMYSPSFCYKQKDWMQANIQNSKILTMISHQKFVNALAKLSKQLKTKVNFWKLTEYYDNAICMIYQQREILPIYNNMAYISTFNAIYTLDMYIKLFYTQQQLATISTGYFNETVNHFRRVINNQDGVQWAFYSAHDTTVGNFLAALNLTNVDCIYDAFVNGIIKNTDTCILEYPTYSSNLIFEIYKYTTKGPIFKIRYNGEYRKIPFCNWQTECSVEVFYSWYDSWKNQKYIKSCGIKNSEAETYFSIAVVQLGIIFIFLLAAVINYLQSRKGKAQVKHSKVAGEEIKQKLMLQPQEDISESTKINQVESLISHDEQ